MQVDAISTLENVPLIGVDRAEKNVPRGQLIV
jgi:hypothetical protein